MLFNKWIRFAMSASVAVFGMAAGLDWSSIVSAATAGKIIGALGMAKMAMDALSPAVGQAIVASGNVVVTHDSAISH